MNYFPQFISKQQALKAIQNIPTIMPMFNQQTNIISNQQMMQLPPPNMMAPPSNIPGVSITMTPQMPFPQQHPVPVPP